MLLGARVLPSRNVAATQIATILQTAGDWLQGTPPRLDIGYYYNLVRDTFTDVTLHPELPSPRQITEIVEAVLNAPPTFDNPHGSTFGNQAGYVSLTGGDPTVNAGVLDLLTYEQKEYAFSPALYGRS